MHDPKDRPVGVEVRMTEMNLSFLGLSTSKSKHAQNHPGASSILIPVEGTLKFFPNQAKAMYFKELYTDVKPVLLS